MIHRYLLLLALVCLAPAAFGADKPCSPSVSLSPGTGCFLFKDPAAPKPLPVHYHVPKGTGAATKILFSMHGMSRTAKSHRDIWIQEANKRGFVVLAPEFSKADFPSEMSYTLGNMGEPKASTAENLWGFSLIERLFDAAKSALKGSQAGYVIFGHSAGAQFVHRMILFKSSARIERAVAANAGVYALPSLADPYPHGVGQTAVTKAGLGKSLTKALTILLGEKDDDPNDKKLATGKAASAQGKNRVERGKSFFKAAEAEAKALGVKLGFKLKTVPGVAHNPAGCVPDAAKALFDAP